MAENENELGDETLEETPKEHPIDKRINKALSEKTKAEQAAAKAEEEKAKAFQEAEAAKKDAEFYKNFNNISTKFPGAGDYQDAIREKVNSGLSLDDAALLVMTKEGKYTPPQAPPPPKESPAGGSAPINVNKGNKSISEMSQEERREILRDNLGLSL